MEYWRRLSLRNSTPARGSNAASIRTPLQHSRGNTGAARERGPGGEPGSAEHYGNDIEEERWAPVGVLLGTQRAGRSPPPGLQPLVPARGARHVE